MKYGYGKMNAGEMMMKKAGPGRTKATNGGKAGGKGGPKRPKPKKGGYR